MTVGIGAICGKGSSPEVVAAADRMVTFGQGGGVEYEDTQSKLEPLIDEEGISAVAVGAGDSTTIDHIVSRSKILIDSLDENPQSVEAVRNLVVRSYQDCINETIENQVLSPLGYTYEGLGDDEVRVPTEIQRAIVEKSLKIRENLEQRVHILVAGAAESGGHISLVAGGDYGDFSKMGYAVIGSGADSARLTFTRRDYDAGCPTSEGVFTVLEAKSQAEERQGVGTKMDMVKASPDGIEILVEETNAELEDMLSEIEEREAAARENVMNKWDNNST